MSKGQRSVVVGNSRIELVEVRLGLEVESEGLGVADALDG